MTENQNLTLYLIMDDCVQPVIWSDVLYSLFYKLKDGTDDDVTDNPLFIRMCLASRKAQYRLENWALRVALSRKVP